MERENIPSEGTFVKLTFEGEFEEQSPIEGRVLDVDTECEDVPSTSLMIVVNDEKGGRRVIYSEGIHEGEEWSGVSVVNRNITLGENAECQRLQ